MNKLDNFLAHAKAGLVFAIEIPWLLLGCSGIWMYDRAKDTVNHLIVGQDSER